MPFRNFFCICVVTLLAAACTTFEPGQTIDLTVEPNDVGGQNTMISAARPRSVPRSVEEKSLPRPTNITPSKPQAVTQRQRAEDIEDTEADFSSIQGAPKLQAIPRFPPPKDRDLTIITNKMAGRRVEIYDLDKPVSAKAPSGPRPVGVPSAVDSRVTIYPLDPVPQSFPGRWPNDVLPMPGRIGAAGQDLPVAKPESGNSQAAAGTIFFDHGSASLGSAGSALIGAVSVQKPAALTVEGHASHETEVDDPIEAKISNLRQSMDRAFEVSKGLIRGGVPAERVKTVAWGDAQATDDEAKSRRVDIRAGHR